MRPPHMFNLQIHEADGQRFEDLFTKIMSYKCRDFQPVKPYGNIGDRKNDGLIESENTYFQVYAPETVSKNINLAINKLRNDFEGLHKHWNELCEIKKFYFVLNDKYKGAPPQLHQEMLRIKLEFNLEDAKVFVAKDLDHYLFDLKDDQILSVVGHIPDIDNEEYMFISGFTGFITAWIQFEKISRYKVAQLTTQRGPVVGMILIQELKIRNFIDEQDYEFIRRLNMQRNQLIHGDSLDIPKKIEIDRLILITEKL